MTMKKIVYLLIVHQLLLLLSCKNDSQEYFENIDNNIQNKENIFLLRETLSYGGNILNYNGIKVGEKRFYIVNELLSGSNLAKFKEKIIEMKDMFEDTTDVSFLFNQANIKVDSVLDDRLFRGFTNDDRFEIVSLKNVHTSEVKENIVYQMSFPFFSSEKSTAFIVTQATIGSIKKEWMSVFLWNEERKQYEIFLAVSLGDDEFGMEFSKEGWRAEEELEIKDVE
jgi:PBP1b-binding outer membrane lipoprotein LpoB